MTDATNSSSRWTSRRVRPGDLGLPALRRRDARFSSVFDTQATQYNNLRESTTTIMDELILILTTMPDDDAGR